MQTDGLDESDNVEDRRGSGPAVGATVGGGGLIVLVLALVFGVNPQQLAGLVGQRPGGANPVANGPVTESDAEKQERILISKVLRDTEKVWTKIFQENGKKYRLPKLVIFRGRTDTACGLGDKATGPFYCPGDEHVYIDLGFFDVMRRDLKIPGDFPEAYVIAHEVGHHVQKLTGYTARVDSARDQSKAAQLQNSVRLELQADYLAGVWAHYAEQRFHLTDADIAQAINAAKQIGDDTLQKKATGTVRPETFTHGSSAQRMKWFKKGYDTGSFDGMAELFSLPYGSL